jgi:hypothetical protein
MSKNKPKSSPTVADQPAAAAPKLSLSDRAALWGRENPWAPGSSPPPPPWKPTSGPLAALFDRLSPGQKTAVVATGVGATGWFVATVGYAVVKIAQRIAEKGGRLRVGPVEAESNAFATQLIGAVVTGGFRIG